MSVSNFLFSSEPRRDLLTNVESRAGASLISQFDYVNDALGRRTLRVDNATTTNLFSYNSRSELINAVMPVLSGVEGGANAFAWVYDSIGNRQTYTTNGTTFTYTANNLNQYTQIADGGVKNLAYDLDGNLTNDGQWAYTWDGENRMVMAEPLAPTAGAQRVRNAYDYMGRRVEKIVDTWDGSAWVGQSTNLFVYDGWNLISEERSTLAAPHSTNFYVWGPDLSGSIQGAGGVGGLLCVIRNGTPYFPCYDANGNITDYVDTNGVSVAHREFDAFGNTLVATGPMVNDFPFWFSTKYLDQETGLYYYGYRYYSPSLGRWLARDPVGEMGGLNVYEFCINDPIQHVDPLGDIPVWAERLAKEIGFLAWRTAAVRDAHWREVMDAWYYETGPNPVTYTGISDPRNADIASNPGFVKLLNCWIAKKRGETVPSGRWQVKNWGVQWQYSYLRIDAAGGMGAYRSDTEFLGTYSANITALGSASRAGFCKYKIHAWNRAGWSSGTRLPEFIADALRTLGWSGTSLSYNHSRGGARYSPSRGGDLDQNYDFETEAECCAKCVLP